MYFRKSFLFPGNRDLEENRVSITFLQPLSTEPRRTLDSYIAQMPTNMINESFVTETSEATETGQLSVKRLKQMTLYSR